MQAVDGPCSDLVDGRSPATTVAMDRESGRVTTSPEAEAIGLAPAVLDQLRSTALRVETLFGCPQDIERSFAGGDVWLLQARPIVGMRKPVKPEEWDPGDGRRWTLVDYGKPLPPLAQEIKLTCLRGAARGSAETGNRIEHHRVLVREGYLYLGPEDAEDAASRRGVWGGHVAELLAEGRNVYTDVIAPEVRKRQAELERYRSRRLSVQEAVRFLSESLRYAEDLGELHWKAVWGVCIW